MQVPVDRLVGKSFGQYELEQLLGQGSVSSAYVARPYGGEQTVMLTLITLPQNISSRTRERFIERFVREASPLKHLHHPNIVPVYDCGELGGYPYLVTPLSEGGSLSVLLKQRARCTPSQALSILKPVATGLHYAHQSQCVHGSLKLSNILLDGQQRLQIAGFGMTRLLEMRGIGLVQNAYPHLFSVAGTLLYNPAYIAPEIVQGQPATVQSDVYSLGIIVFELLSGHPPFRGDDPFEVAKQHVYQRVPALQEFVPEAPAALDLVLQRALERDPKQRLSSVLKLAEAFERTLQVLQAADPYAPTTAQVEAIQAHQYGNWKAAFAGTSPAQKMNSRQTSAWLVEESPSEDSWLKASTQHPPLQQGVQGTLNAGQEAGNGSPNPNAFSPAFTETGMWKREVPLFSKEMQATRRTEPAPTQNLQTPRQSAPTPASNTQQLQATQRQQTQQMGMFSRSHQAQPVPMPLAQGSGDRHEQTVPWSVKQQEMQNVQVETEQQQVGRMGVGAETRLASVQPGTFKSEEKNAPTEPATNKKSRRKVLIAVGSVAAAGVVGAGGFGLFQLLQPKNKPATTTPAAAPMNNNPAKPAGKQGKVITDKQIALNSAIDFVNPKDNKESILVRLPSGEYAAYEKACTHQGVLVKYHPDKKQLICPLHGSIFDPAKNGAVVNGPAQTPLPSVIVNVQPDGTVTV